MVKSILSVIVLISCSSVQTQYSSDRPMNKGFTLNISNTDTIRNNIISIGVVYIKTETIEIKNAETNQMEITKINSFLRFFKEGRFIYGSTKNFETGINDYNNLQKGIIGYYKIKNNEKILCVSS